MKRCISIVLFIMVMSIMTGCAAGKYNEKEDQKFQIVAAGYAEYDWICQIAGERKEQMEIRMLLDGGVDLHSFQPSVADMVQISEADLFVYVDASENSWVDEAMQNVSNENQIAINLMDLLGDKAIANQHDHDHDHEEDSNHSHEEILMDEHVWLSLKNAIQFCEALTEALKSMDPEYADLYQKQADEYIKKLQELDQQYQKTVDTAEHKTLIFCDRYPFRYLLEDYELECHAAFAGCTTDTEASFETIQYLSEVLVSSGVDDVITIEGSNVQIGQTVLDTAKRDGKILSMNSMQSVTSKETEQMSYIAVMEENLKVLQEALN